MIEENGVKVKIKKMFDDVEIPQYSTDGSGCFDIKAYEFVDGGPHAATWSTGLMFEVPEGHVMMVYSRSGQGFNHDVRLANCVGVIDSDYRGELKVKLTLDVGKFWERPAARAKKGDKIAQAMIIPIPKVAFEVVDELSSTERGEDGFGSTGA